MDCDAAKSYFAEHDVEYIAQDIEASARAKRELIKLVGFAAVPTLVIDRQVIWGFAGNRERIEALLSNQDE